MSLKELFRKKTVAQILKQVETGGVGHDSLSKHLGVRDLTAFGIAAIIGAGIFTTIGQASADGGPGVVFLFLFTAIACSFAAFAYAEFASMVPVSGSAYTYSYVAFGELFAWIIGWALIMEYGIGNITVAIGWSEYFTSLLSSGGIHLPVWMTTDFITAHNGFTEAETLMQSGKIFNNLDEKLQLAHNAWTTSPAIGPLHIIANTPALMIVSLITALVYKGIKESRNASNLMVVIKLCVVLLVIAVGIFYVDTANWHPFTPHGIPGILKGVSAVFFAYIGFDAISTTAEECKNPQRDLPKGMMWAIIICTVLYISIALVLTGMVKYDQLAVADPLSEVFKLKGLKWMSGIVAVSAIVAMASVLLVFQMGQPRIWMSMSRDGLLPKIFSRIHPKFKTPSFSTIVTGLMVIGGTLFMNISTVTDLCSIGTLFAFVLVCAGVLRMQNQTDIPRGKFKTPYVNSKFIMPVLLIAAIVVSFSKNGEGVMNFLTNKPVTKNSTDLITSLSKSEIDAVKMQVQRSDSIGFAAGANDLQVYLSAKEKDDKTYQAFVNDLLVPSEKKIDSGFDLFKYKIPMWIFIISSLLIVGWCVRANLSLIPVLGLLSCLYMMSQIELKNWIGFMVWLVIGLVIYFTYSIKNSKLSKVQV